MLSQPSPSPELIREFVIAGHGNLPKVQQMLTERPDLLNLSHEWNPGDRETALMGASHVGSRAVAEFLLSQGGVMEICTAAMLGLTGVVKSFLDGSPALAQANGAHGIPVMAHAALSGQVEVAQMLFDRGTRTGMSMALSNAVMMGHENMVRWLLENGAPDLNWQNYEGKTTLQVAAERGRPEIIQLLYQTTPGRESAS